MTKQAVFGRLLATFAVTGIVISSYANAQAQTNGQGAVQGVADADLAPALDAQALDLSERTLRRAIRDSSYEQMASGIVIPGPVRRAARNSRVARLRVVTVDTRDQATCAQFRQLLETMNPARIEDKTTHLCDQTATEPLKSVVVLDEIDSEAFRRELGKNLLHSSDRSLVAETRNLALAPGKSSGVLWNTQEVAKWDQQKTADEFGFTERIPYKGGATDAIKPLAGAATYTMARQQGKSRLESFGQSIATSTFFWEHGTDSLPNGQDLLLAPVVGAALGEYFFSLEKSIQANQGEFMGSKAAGSFAMVVLNPAESVATAMNQAAGKRIVKNAHSELILKRYSNGYGQQTNHVGIQMSFQFLPR